jgi:hypothetical protein
MKRNLEHESTKKREIFSPLKRDQEMPYHVSTQGAYVVGRDLGTPRSHRINRFEDVRNVNQHTPSSIKTPEGAYVSSGSVIAPDEPGR